MVAVILEIGDTRGVGNGGGDKYKGAVFNL
jgi:hypothetical protein